VAGLRLRIPHDFSGRQTWLDTCSSGRCSACTEKISALQGVTRSHAGKTVVSVGLDIAVVLVDGEGMMAVHVSVEERPVRSFRLEVFGCI